MQERNRERGKKAPKIAAGFINVFHNPLTAWFILGMSIILTIAAYYISNKFVNDRAEDRFNFRVEEITEAIKSRMLVYESVLRGSVGLFLASQEVSREEWKEYVTNLQIDKYWPGIQGMGYSIPVKKEDKEAHIQEIRSEGFSEYTIKPDGERDEYSAIIYLEPFDWRNQRAFGYDMWSNDIRRQAMERARDTGEAATSGIITLVQESKEDVQKGFLTYVPFYRANGNPLETVEQRRGAFQGWVYAPFRSKDLMHGIFGSTDSAVNFEIFDGQEMTADNLLYDSDNIFHLKDTYSPELSKVINITLQGRPWTVYFESSKAALAGGEEKQPKFVAIAGLVVDVLLFYIIWSIYFLQKRAEMMVEEKTREINLRTQELQKERDSLDLKVKERTLELDQAQKTLTHQVEERTQELKQKMDELERSNKIMVGREMKMVELKKENEELKEQLGK